MATAATLHHFSPTTPRHPSLSPFSSWSGLRRSSTNISRENSIFLRPSPPPLPKSLSFSPLATLSPPLPFPVSRPHRLPTSQRRSTAASAGRSKKKPGGPSTGRIEGNAEVRRRAKTAARKRTRRFAENLFYRHNNPSSNQADRFTDEELQMIGLGYDRTVRFMAQDDPALRHPHDWYKYGLYGPYSWRGVVIGRPIRGRFSDDRVTMIGEVRDQDEWEKIERFEMTSDYSERLKALDSSVGFRYFWVFVRHPKWKTVELPWQQWTLVAEVTVEARKQQRLDKWTLMGRLGNKTRAMITQCAAWMRPDIIYVRRPVYQCRFEPQDDFFRVLAPLLDPDTEEQYLFELKDEQGRVVDVCTYFAGLCKIVRIGQKAFVDDVVRAYQKMSEEGKSMCLEFLLTNHPMELLHPYTKEWKAKLEEMELGCDAPDESDSEDVRGENEAVEWIETDDDDDDDDDEEEDLEDSDEEEDAIVDVGEEDEEEVDKDEGEAESEDDDAEPEEGREYWKQQWEEALKNPEAMEKLVKRRVEAAAESRKREKMNEQRNRAMAEAMEIEAEDCQEAAEVGMMEEMQVRAEGGEEAAAMVMRDEEAERKAHRGVRRKVKKSRIPPELFLRAAVRPFTYRNLVKEIVLLRHAIVDKEVNAQA